MDKGDSLGDTGLILQLQQKVVQLQNKLDDRDEDPSYGKRRAQDLIRVKIWKLNGLSPNH